MSESDSFALGLDEPPRPAAPHSPFAQPYRVLARKYRPQGFDQLIGQDAMVTTLGNAIARDRLAHAFLLTGVRGVGKTSTARLIAKALNCIGPDGQGGPTISPCGTCEPCIAIAEGRHIDVIEMDAASHTGVDDVREIIDAVRYSAVSARFKVYIIDEVHMLSKNAFNALLKTLEEPPPHVKFLFATTEVNKVPVTVLSRCQRFDLRRIPADALAAHFARVAEAEGVSIDPEALALVARAAEGSARDGLSILDQAIASGSGTVTADQVRAMLGLSDRGAVRRVFALLLAGDATGALDALRDQYDLGVEPAAVVRALLECVHAVTRVKLGGHVDPAQSAEERAAYEEFASRLGHGQLHRLWQMLLKGLHEVGSAPVPIEAAEMALLRLIYASELPDPGALIDRLRSGEGVPAAPAAPPPPAPPAPPAGPPESFLALVERLEGGGHPLLGHQLRDEFRLAEYSPPLLRLQPGRMDEAPRRDAFLRELRGALNTVAAGQMWRVELTEGEAQPSLREQEQADGRRIRDEVLADPAVAAIFETFPDAELISHGGTDRRSA